MTLNRTRTKLVKDGLSSTRLICLFLSQTNFQLSEVTFTVLLLITGNFCIDMK